MKSELQCPPTKVIYKFVPQHMLDVQFGDDNKPSQIYNDMFTKSSIWVGGYDLGSGKTYTTASKSKTP
jgi:hypothetical protein